MLGCPFQDEPGQSTALRTLTKNCSSRISTSTMYQCHSISDLFSGKSPSSISNALTHCTTKHSTKLSSEQTPKHNQTKRKDTSPSELLSLSTGSLATAEAKRSFPTRPFIHCLLRHYDCQQALNLPNSNLIALTAQF